MLIEHSTHIVHLRVRSQAHRNSKRYRDDVSARVGNAYLCQILEEWYEVEELSVVHVVEPRVYGNSIFRVEHVGSGRVVDDDNTLQRAPDATKILLGGEPDETRDER